MATKTVIAFDLFGTILSTESIWQEIFKFASDDKAKTIASLARQYQLEYTWRSNSMGIYRPFDELTRQSFRHAAAEVGLELSPEQEESIMNAYNGLDAFPDVPTALSLLEANPTLDAWVLSNGTPSMVTSSLATSRGISEAATRMFLPDKVVSVDAEELRVYKPDPRPYRHLTSVAGVHDRASQAWLVSSNPFDVLGAVAYSLKAAWVDRAGTGWIDGLGGAVGLRPTVVVKGVDEAVRVILERRGGE